MNVITCGTFQSNAVECPTIIRKWRMNSLARRDGAGMVWVLK
jgi:hypothetical protein